jgi:hypothetical protein
MGDPGLFSFLGKVGKAAVGGAAGFLTGGIGGAAAGVAGALRSSNGGSVSVPQGPMSLPSPTAVVLPMPGAGSVAVDPFAVLPGGKPFVSRVSTNGAGAPKGFHLNKADYFLRDGTFVPKGSKWVRNRSRNPLNPRALQRAVARVDAGKTWQGKLHEIETGKYTKAGNRKTC